MISGNTLTLYHLVEFLTLSRFELARTFHFLANI